MDSNSDSHLSLPIACSLSPAELAARRTWILPRLLAHADLRESTPEGYRWRFAPRDELLVEAARVIDAERRCCLFLSFTLSVEPNGGPIWLEVSGPEGTREFLTALIEDVPSQSGGV